MEAHEFLLKHSQELSEKYPGKYLAVVKDDIVAVDRNAFNVFKQAKEKFPGEKIHISYMPTEEELVTLL